MKARGIVVIDYDIEGSAIQTFDTIYAQKAPVEESLEEEDGGSCSVEAAACSTPPKVDIGGLGLKVLDNWGNGDFTCIYRFRVHGQPLF